MGGCRAHRAVAVVRRLDGEEDEPEQFGQRLWNHEMPHGSEGHVLVEPRPQVVAQCGLVEAKGFE